jgi:hypothetical protein
MSGLEKIERDEFSSYMMIPDHLKINSCPQWTELTPTQLMAEKFKGQDWRLNLLTKARPSIDSIFAQMQQLFKIKEIEQIGNI